jgi:hypothetical protein
VHPWQEQVAQSAVSGFDWSGLSALASIASAVVSAAALACTLRFLLRQDRILTHQLELSTETKRYELYQNVMKEMQEISRIFLCSPELRRYFYECAPLPCDDEGDLLARAEVMSEMIVDFMALTLNTFRLFSEEEKKGWIVYFQEIGRTSPAIRSFWTEHREWYEPPVWSVLEPVVQSMAAEERPELVAVRLSN